MCSGDYYARYLSPFSPSLGLAVLSSVSLPGALHRMKEMLSSSSTVCEEAFCAVALLYCGCRGALLPCTACPFIFSCHVHSVQIATVATVAGTATACSGDHLQLSCMAGALAGALL